MEMLLKFFADNLIQFMGGVLTLGLVFRFLAYRQSKNDGAYFSTFSREIQRQIEKDKEAGIGIDDTDSYLSELLGRVNSRLPARTLRFKGSPKGEEETTEGKREYGSLRDFVSSKEGMIASIQSESGVFNVKTPPNFTELTHRILEQDKHWTKLLGVVPIEGVSRMIDLLPNLFIVFGVFGTFIGISMALPEIANIDFNNLEGSQETLTSFVLNVTFAMKTSIAGIFFSLILTFLNTLFPIRDVRNRIFRKVENCFQAMWYHIQKENNSNNVKVIMKEMLECLKEIRDGSKASSNDENESGLKEVV